MAQTQDLCLSSLNADVQRLKVLHVKEETGSNMLAHHVTRCPPTGPQHRFTSPASYTPDIQAPNAPRQQNVLEKPSSSSPSATARPPASPCCSRLGKSRSTGFWASDHSSWGEGALPPPCTQVAGAPRERSLMK